MEILPCWKACPPTFASDVVQASSLPRNFTLSLPTSSTPGHTFSKVPYFNTDKNVFAGCELLKTRIHLLYLCKQNLA